MSLIHWVIATLSLANANKCREFEARYLRFQDLELVELRGREIIFWFEEIRFLWLM